MSRAALLEPLIISVKQEAVGLNQPDTRGGERDEESTATKTPDLPRFSAEPTKSTSSSFSLDFLFIRCKLMASSDFMT